MALPERPYLGAPLPGALVGGRSSKKRLCVGLL